MAIGQARYRGLRGSIPIQLTVDTPQMVPGREAHFRIVGAPPNQPIYWSSYKNGQSTRELNASYGQVTEANGTAEIPYTPTGGDVGSWVKEILVQDGAGNNYTAMVQYIVAPAPAPVSSPITTSRSGSGFLDRLMNEGFYLGNTFIPYLYAGVGGVAAFYFLKRR